MASSATTEKQRLQKEQREAVAALFATGAAPVNLPQPPLPPPPDRQFWSEEQAQSCLRQQLALYSQIQHQRQLFSSHVISGRIEYPPPVTIPPAPRIPPFSSPTRATSSPPLAPSPPPYSPPRPSPPPSTTLRVNAWSSAPPPQPRKPPSPFSARQSKRYRYKKNLQKRKKNQRKRRIARQPLLHRPQIWLPRPSSPIQQFLQDFNPSIPPPFPQVHLPIAPPPFLAPNVTNNRDSEGHNKVPERVTRSPFPVLDGDRPIDLQTRILQDMRDDEDQRQKCRSECCERAEKDEERIPTCPRSAPDFIPLSLSPIPQRDFRITNTVYINNTISTYFPIRNIFQNSICPSHSPSSDSDEIQILN